EVALEARAVVALEDAQLVDLALEQATLLLEGRERALRGLLGLAHDACRLRLGLRDDPVALLLARTDVVVVELLRELEHAGRRLGLALPLGRGCGGRDRGAHRGGGRLGGDRSELRLGG